jgi:hypothetical protein
LTQVITRLDRLCDIFDRLAGMTREKAWPEELQLAAAKLAKSIESLAGSLDGSDGDTAAIRDLIVEARRSLPDDFAAFGQAIVADLAKQSGLT